MPPPANFPGWIARALADGTLPWASAPQTTLATFLAQYTLHDSYLD
jgi:hypothetical protein